MNAIYIDTHCHLNFKRFRKDYEEVIGRAREKGLAAFVVPGTDIALSQKAVELAHSHEDVYAAVGIHPHHTFNLKDSASGRLEEDMAELEKLLPDKKVVAIGEVGLDAHVYEETKYVGYKISDEFMHAQTAYFQAELHLALKYDKSFIIHNRETKSTLLSVLDSHWSDAMRNRTVFHCCEPDGDLLEYAVSHDIFIGVDGDVTYGGEKAEFVKKVPLDRLVLETDSPFLLPEPLKTQKLYPNTPVNVPLIAECISRLKNIPLQDVAETTTRNAKRLFTIP